MKRILNSKAFALILTAFMALCAVFGIFMTLPRHTALADTETQYTNETFPDTSDWYEENLAAFDEEGTQIIIEYGAIYRVHYVSDLTVFTCNYIVDPYNPENGSHSSGVIITCKDGDITVDTTNLLGSTVFVYKISENAEGKYVDFVNYTGEGSIEGYHECINVNANGEAVTDIAELEGVVAKLSEEAPEGTTNEPTDDGKIQDKVADWINENTGLALSGSAVLIIGGVIIVYVLFIKKRR